jgi:hypothetical protein
MVVSATVREATPHANQTSRTTISDVINNFSQTHETNEDHTSEKIEALAEIICGASDQSAAALFVLMGRLQNSTHPKRTQTLRSILPLLVAASSTFAEWLMLNLRSLRTSC